MKKLSGIFFVPAEQSFVAIWDGKEIGGCTLEYLQNAGEHVKEAWGLLYQRWRLTELFISSPEITIEFLKHSDGTECIERKRPDEKSREESPSNG